MKAAAHALMRIQEDIHNTARAKGWWDEPREDGTMIALMHSELSEALEALRAGNPADDKIPEYEAVIIRTMKSQSPNCRSHNTHPRTFSVGRPFRVPGVTFLR